MVSYVVSGKVYTQISKTKGELAMKKILTILAATATMFAFGAGNLDTTISHGADFEAFTAGNAFSAGLNDSAQPSAPFYWYTADTDAANIISNYTGSGVRGQYVGVRGQSWSWSWSWRVEVGVRERCSKGAPALAPQPHFWGQTPR